MLNCCIVVVYDVGFNFVFVKIICTDFILNEREFDVFIGSLFDFLKSEKNDVVLLTPICFVDKNSFIKGFKGAFVHNEHS